jgi:hypothetical protein
MNTVYEIYIPLSRYQVGILIMCTAQWLSA